MTEVQRARKQVKVPHGEARRLARQSHRATRREVRQALRDGDYDRATSARPRSIAWELS